MRAHVITLSLGSLLATCVAFAGCAQTGADEDPPPVTKPDAGAVKDSGVRDTGVANKDSGVALDTGVATDTGVPEVDSGVAQDSGSSVPVCSKCNGLGLVQCELERQLAASVAACSDCVAGTCCYSSVGANKIFCLTP